MHRRHLYLLLSCTILFLTSCNSDGYRQVKNGVLEYRLHHSEGGPTPELGDVMKMNMVFRHGDSVLSDSRESGPVHMIIDEPAFRGDILEGLILLSIGDSATFRVSADSMYGNHLPQNMQPGDFLKFDVKVLNITNPKKAMHEFLEREGHNMKKTESGIYYEFLSRGEGQKPKRGDTSLVHYRVVLLDGQVYSDSYQNGEPVEFIAGYGYPVEGWDELLFKMQTGDKVHAVLPYELAFKEGGTEDGVPPFAPIYVELELLDLKRDTR